MTERTCLTIATAMACLLPSLAVQAQDVPGIEICTVDKTWERRTSCLQSNVDFLVKTINKMKSDQDQKFDTLRRLIDAQTTAIATLQKMVTEMQGAKKPDAASVVKEAPAAAAK